MIAHNSTLLDALKDAPDPCQARGQRYAWLLLLTRMGGAWARGQRTPHAMADWVRLHTVELREALHVARERLASEATVRRVLRAIDQTVLEQRLAQFAESLAAETPTAGTVQMTLGGRPCKVKPWIEKLCAGRVPTGQPRTWSA